ncbi:hypothetical protein QBC35DRAFT_450835 [Podospora australis]|uniref:DNA repair protein Rad26 n=1 Tax=Podospora australis TaxID=1536484 RepID=A0AAN6WWG2_9PEZI|nr:hypothetical protein QBC35DRAFT_450835 [Podospora australis]
MDEYSDDEFLDDLPESELQELENNAIQLTQAKLGQSQYLPSQLSSRVLPPPKPPPPPAPAPAPAAGPTQDYGDYGLDDDDDLDDTVVFEVAGGENAGRTDNSFSNKPHINSNLAEPGEGSWDTPLNQSANHQPGPSHHPQQRQVQYPIPRPIPHHVPAPRHVHPAPQYQSQQRYPPPPPPRPSQFVRPPVPVASQFSRPPPPAARQYPGQQSQLPNDAGAGNKGDIIAALQARLSRLESEVIASKGEAAILRSKYAQIQTEHETAIARLKQQNAEQLAKQERALEEVRAAERNASTELQFAREDLREGFGRARHKRKDGTTTPKKGNKTRADMGMGDGFDTLEVTHSPSKGQAALRRHNSGPGGSSTHAVSERTPTKGKRKRPPLDNPSFALETNEDEARLEHSLRTEAIESAVYAPPSAQPYDFLQLVLDHHSLHGQPPTFDLFSRFAFKSEPNHTFASMIFQKLPQLGSSREPKSLLVDFAEMIIDIWQRCLTEQYHAPIYHLASLVLYTMDLNAVAVAPQIISSLVPTCTTTCQLIALLRYRSPDGDLAANSDKVIRRLCSVIDVPQCMSVLYLAALGCMAFPLPDQNEPFLSGRLLPQARFWRTLAPDFVLMMLSPKQPELDWYGILALLRTSILPRSIGPIPNPVSKASFNKDNNRDEAEELAILSADIVDKVSFFLGESPRWAPRNSLKEVEVRTAALKTLAAFASSPYGAQMIAHSDHAIPRLATVLCWAIDQLYEVDPGLPFAACQKTAQAEDMMDIDGGVPSKKEKDNKLTTEERGEGAKKAALLSQLVRNSTSLLHLLLTDSRTASIVDMSAKLAASHGGAQRYLLTLARLNFAAEEPSFLEAGILSETVDLAHDLLELAVNPDDAEEIQKAFGVL